MLRLMVVDDEPVILNGLIHMIEQEQSLFTKVEGFIDSVEALEKVEEFRPDLLITDIQMPEIDGLELIKQTRDKQVKRFVILTGYDMFTYAQKALRLRVSDYLLKPIRQAELSQLLIRYGNEIMAEYEHEQASHAGNLDIQPSEHSSACEMNASILKFQSFIQEHYIRDVSLDEVAEHLQLHPNYLCQLLKRETGETFIQYLNSVRIQKAKQLLRQTDLLSMEQVAKQVGYENTRHFYKVFKQYVGLTPGSFREHSRQDADV